MDKAVSSEPRGYKDAIAQLNSLQSNAETIRKSAECRRDPAQHIPQMRDYLTRVGLSDDYCGDMPFYFSFLTVMSLYVFVREAVNVAILEVGIGGEYDSTNVVQRPVVCGVTSLDLDHTNLLGNTLDKIAWQKAGIFKSGVPAITVPQSTDSVRDVMLKRAKEKGAYQEDFRWESLGTDRDTTLLWPFNCVKSGYKPAQIGLACGAGRWLPEGVSNPAPLPPQDLLGRWFLPRSLPQLFVPDLLWPSDVEDAPQTAWAAWDRDEKISAVMVENGNTETGQHVQVLVTGSLYLVGAVLGGLAE
nr:hypothetical protein BaRGS_001787 [Batillaria attramentaria]